MHPRQGFDNVPEIYDRIRPGYPAELFADLFGLLPERPRIIEVGPGTGQATRDLLAHGARVHAIELGANLVAASFVIELKDLHGRALLGETEVNALLTY